MKCPYCGANSDKNICPNCFAEIPIPVKKIKSENKEEKKDEKET
jgi:hypothetical protein